MLTPEQLAQNRLAQGKEYRVSQPELLALYAGAVTRSLADLNASRLCLKVPALKGLRKKSGAPFHATPELFFAQLGSTEFEMPEEKFVVGAGDLCLVPRGMPHAERVLDKPGKFLTLITMFWPDGFSFHFGHGSNEGRVTSDPHTRFKVDGDLIPYCLDEVAKSMNGAKGALSITVKGLMTAVFGAMLEALKSPYDYSHSNYQLIGRCLGLIQVNLHEPKLSVQWLAERLGCTPDHLSRAFQMKTGRSLIHTINQARIEHAVTLLADSSFNIGEIAWASGFSTQSYFNRVFVKRMNMTPKQYRASIGTLPIKAGDSILNRLLK